MKYLVLPLLLIVMNCYLQSVDGQTSTQKKIDKIYETKRQIDSSRAKLQESIAASIAESKRVMDSVNLETFRKQNERNLNDLMYMQRERNKKEKQRMWLRLGFGIAILSLGIFAMLRRRKK